MSGAPYKVTPIFDERSLPAGLRRDHETKPGVWGVIRVIEGRLRLVLAQSDEETVLTPERLGLVLPAQRHFVEPLGRMRMQVEFHHSWPDELEQAAGGSKPDFKKPAGETGTQIDG